MVDLTGDVAARFGRVVRARRLMRRAIACGTITAALAVTLVACSIAAQPIPSRQSLVGSWMHGSGATLLLSSDGKAKVSSIPEQAINDPTIARGERPGGKLITTSGTWTQGGSIYPHRDSAGFPVIYLILPSVGSAGFTWILETHGTGKSRSLVAVLGDPDNNNAYALIRQH